MDTDQRLAAYLSGDLDADDAAALEAELAGDPGLRARLDGIRATDELLGDLPDVELPDGFTARLDEALAPELDRVLGDELAARRARRQMPGWLPAAAAAALVLVVGGGIVLGGGMGGEDADMAATDAGPETLVQEDAAGGAEQAGDGEEADRAPGPRIVSQGRSVTSEDLSTLASELIVDEVVSGERVAEDPGGTAALYASSLGGPTAERQAAGDDAAGTQTTEAMSTTGAPVLAREGDVDPDDVEDVGRCLSVLSEDAADPVVPLYAELATDEDGTPVIVYAALSTDADGEYQRVEVWMVERATCTLRQFAQDDR